MPTLGAFVVLWNDPYLYIPLETSIDPWIVILAVIFICTYLLPVILSFTILKMGWISSMSHPSEADRKILLGATALCFAFAYYKVNSLLGSAQSLNMFLLGVNISIVTTLITALFTKVSFHSVGVGGLLGTVIGLIQYTHLPLYPWLAGAFAIVVLTALARYKSNAHQAFEIYVGLIIGIATQALVFFFSAHGV